MTETCTIHMRAIQLTKIILCCVRLNSLACRRWYVIFKTCNIFSLFKYLVKVLSTGTRQIHYNINFLFTISVAIYFCIIAVDVKYSSLESLSTTGFSDFLNTKNMQTIAPFHMAASFPLVLTKYCIWCSIFIIRSFECVNT